MTDHTETGRGLAEAPLLFLHGGGVAGWMWDPVRAHLSDAYRVMAPDLPGHGSRAGEDYTSHADTISHLAEMLESETAPASVVGFSLGAQLAVLLAARRPDLVSRVVVVSAQAVPSRAPRATLALLDASASLARRRWFALAQSRALFVPDELREDYVRTSAAISRRTLHRAVEENIRFTVPQGWSSFSGSALVLAGADERNLMKRSAAVLHRSLPHSESEIVDGCGHGIPLQRPAWFARRLESWLRGAPAHKA